MSSVQSLIAGLVYGRSMRCLFPFDGDSKQMDLDEALEIVDQAHTWSATDAGSVRSVPAEAIARTSVPYQIPNSVRDRARVTVEVADCGGNPAGTNPSLYLSLHRWSVPPPEATVEQLSTDLNYAARLNTCSKASSNVSSAAGST